MDEYNFQIYYIKNFSQVGLMREYRERSREICGSCRLDDGT